MRATVVRFIFIVRDPSEERLICVNLNEKKFIISFFNKNGTCVHFLGVNGHYFCV